MCGQWDKYAEREKETLLIDEKGKRLRHHYISTSVDMLTKCCSSMNMDLDVDVQTQMCTRTGKSGDKRQKRDTWSEDTIGTDVQKYASKLKGRWSMRKERVPLLKGSQISNETHGKQEGAEQTHTQSLLHAVWSTSRTLFSPGILTLPTTATARGYLRCTSSQDLHLRKQLSPGTEALISWET